MSFLRYRTGPIAFYLFLVVFTIVSGCGRKETAEQSKLKNEEIVAWVGKEAITINDYKNELAMLSPSYRGIANLDKNRFLESLINKRLLLQEAKTKNLQNSENVKRLFQRIKEEIMIQELIDKAISDKAGLTESEIEQHYRENQNDYAEPAKIKASHILVDSRLLAKKISADLREGAGFEKLTKEYSLDIPTKDRGGNVGYFAKGTLLPEFEEACEKLKVGEISDVVKTDLGYHIIKVLDKKEAEPKPLEEVKDDIKNKLLLEKEISLYDNLLQGLRDKQKISINSQVLEDIDLNQID